MSTLMTLLRHARREWRGAELKPVLAALLVAVAAATGVLAFSDRIERTLSARSGELIGGDAVLSSRQPLPIELVKSAQDAGIATTAVTAFPTVLFAGDASVLVEIKAVAADYPLRGRLKTAAQADGVQSNASAPEPGSLYLDARALAALGSAVGSEVEIGNAKLRIAGILTEDPEGAGSFLTLAPRALLRDVDVAQLGLLGPASRAFHRVLLAGDTRAIEAWASATRPQLKGQRLTLARDAEQQLAEVGRQTRAFFGLSALAVLWLAALAIALTARRYTEARREVVAQLRCFGLSRRRILLQMGATLGLFGLPAILGGIVLGYGLQAVIALGVGSLLAETLPQPGPQAAVLGALVGILAYLSFTLPALSRLAATPPSSLLRQGEDRMGLREWLAYPAALGVLTFAVWLLTGEGQLGLIALAGMSVLALGLGGIMWLLLKLLRKRVPGRSFVVRQALRQFASRPGTTLLSSVSLALALAAVLLLGVVAGDLVRQWRLGLSNETPNRFLLNIQPEQVEPLRQQFAQLGIADAQFFPFAVGRLLAINGEPADAARYPDPRAARFLDGNLNLSWSEELPEANRLTAGQWWSEGDEVSIAENWASIFNLGVGDRITISIGDQKVEARIANVRSVDWDSFRVNFFLLYKPATVAGLESTYVTSVRTDAEQARQLGPLLRAYPNVTLIDVDALLTRILSVVDAVIRSLSAIFWCALAAAACVLVAALAVSAGARRFESALWRSLGASRQTLQRTQWIELCSVGAMGGGFGGLAALATGWALAQRVFQIDYAPPWWLAIAGAALGAGLSLLAGWLVLRGVTSAPPADALRAGAA
ncbi:MAG TPA: FtsX-like permease family protein [Xanthomonadales bacterium]|nr:FtsX-like permease family protein [Xanthomonadales bacterium]